VQQNTTIANDTSSLRNYCLQQLQECQLPMLAFDLIKATAFLTQ